MRVSPIIQYLKRPFLGPLLAIVSVFSFHLTMMGDTPDSLYHVYLNADQGHRIELANTLAHLLYDQEITDTLYQCKSSSSPDLVDATMHYLMAEHYYDIEQYQSAMEEGSQAQALTHKMKECKFLSDLLGVLSNAQFRLGYYNEALKTLLQAYQVDKKMGNQELISSDLNSLAAIYEVVGRPEPGIHYIEKAIEIERKLNRSDRLATRLGLASELYLLNNEPDKAMEAIQEAYTLDKEKGHSEKAAIRLVQKAAILAAMSRLDEARHTITQAMPELEKADNTYSLAVAHNQLGDIEKQLNHNDEALTHYKKALELSILCGSAKVERTVERALWELLRTSNPNQALIHLERYTVLTDSMQNQMSAIQREMMDSTNLDLEQLEVNKKHRQLDSLLMWGGFAICIMLALMLAAAVYLWRRSRKTLQMQRQILDMRSRFFTNVTNKLQTPLTIVMGAGQQLLAGQRVNNDENKRLGEMIVRHGENMLGLVNQLLDIEKVDSELAAPDLKRGDIVMFVRLLVDNFTTDARQKLINLEFHCPVTSQIVIFAPDYIRKIVHELIDNAIRYTSRNGNIVVTLAQTENDKMRLTVSDSGKGIPADERKRIFEPFSQTVNGDEGVETGVGLSLVNQLVLTLQGTITVESETGLGTTFIIDFPVQQVEDGTLPVEETSPQLTAEIMKPSDIKKHKPLAFIVENNKDVAFFIARLLREKFELRFATDGNEALQNALEMGPDLIITTIMMPVMDGKELIRRLRSTGNFKQVPIIAITSDFSEQERLSCIEAGADNVLVKPFNSTELCLVADHLIKQRTAMREIVGKIVDSTPEIPEQELSKEDQQFINRLVNVIHVQISKGNVNVDHIAAALSLSRKQLRTKVMEITGLTTVAYILQVKLNYARRMIANEELSMTEIANKCGFQNLSHFSKAFKQQFGTSPLQFRKSIEAADLM